MRDLIRRRPRCSVRGLLKGACALGSLGLAPAVFAATLGPGISSWLQTAAPDAAYPETVIVSFESQPLQAQELAMLNTLGITNGYTLPELGMVAVTATADQIEALNSDASVRSIWPNQRLQYLDYFGRVLGGVDKLRGDSTLTALHGGNPVFGQDVTVVVNDSGCDVAHADLANAVIGNYTIATDTGTLAGFTPLTVVPGGPNNDTVGHGTHVAGIVAGSGTKSGGLYQGVAPGSDVVCLGSGAGLFILNALGGLEWTIANQATYNIRVETNSWGSSSDYEADGPINIATHLMTDRNIVVLFAAGNAGPGQNTLNPYAMAPWVISVGAGTLEGTLASFSSVGIASRGPDFGLQNGPTIVAPGTGNAFESDADLFSSDIISVRDPAGVLPPLAAPSEADDIPAAYIPFYTEMSGTSMATPYAAGVVALMLSADPTLGVDEVKTILEKTATRMPGYADWQVGAGYVNVWAAVDSVYHRSKPYGTFVAPVYNQTIDKAVAASEDFSIDFVPIPGSEHAIPFEVQGGMELLDILGTANEITGEVGGNTVAMIATDPQGNSFSSAIAIPVLGPINIEVRVPNPVAGTWKLRVVGVCGLAAVPQVCFPSPGAALPGSVSGVIDQWNFALAPAPSDIADDPNRDQIKYVLFNRLMDTQSDGRFHPDHAVTRMEFAHLLALDTPLRQRLDANPAPFHDVSATNMPLAEAVTYDGDVLRDWNFAQGPLMQPVKAGWFGSMLKLHRLNLAIALVRALGDQAAAAELAGSTVTADYNGQPIPVTDNDQIPPEYRGYVQIALDKGILNAYFNVEQGPTDFQPTITAEVRPDSNVPRAFLAYSLAHFNQHFATGQ